MPAELPIALSYCSQQLALRNPRAVHRSILTNFVDKLDNGRFQLRHDRLCLRLDQLAFAPPLAPLLCKDLSERVTQSIR